MSHPAAPPSSTHDREDAELARQGAKAAARGDSVGVNPMEEDGNMPSSTGESSGRWSERRDAWRTGHDRQSETTDPALSLSDKAPSEDD